MMPVRPWHSVAYNGRLPALVEGAAAMHSVARECGVSIQFGCP